MAAHVAVMMMLMLLLLPGFVSTRVPGSRIGSSVAPPAPSYELLEEHSGSVTVDHPPPPLLLLRASHNPAGPHRGHARRLAGMSRQPGGERLGEEHDAPSSRLPCKSPRRLGIVCRFPICPSSFVTRRCRRPSGRTKGHQWPAGPCDEEVNAADCAGAPCRNDGLCHETADGNWRCECRHGFAGELCTELGASLQCERGHMRVTVPAALLAWRGWDAAALRLVSGRCRAGSARGGTRDALALRRRQLGAVRTRVQHNDSHVWFSNAVLVEQEEGGDAAAILNFTCVYGLETLAQLPFAVVPTLHTLTVRGEPGSFHVTMRAFVNASFDEGELYRDGDTVMAGECRSPSPRSPALPPRSLLSSPSPLSPSARSPLARRDTERCGGLGARACCQASACTWSCVWPPPLAAPSTSSAGTAGPRRSTTQTRDLGTRSSSMAAPTSRRWCSTASTGTARRCASACWPSAS
uniref:Uncharacterized protein LOC116955993 n=1 Tax=Petromyzon marinus TaxID=7757 RepID=A0AAJ7XG69_PETMA|nr:uncharacterized protein LOC116955993 [Petromyzon marinus]